MTAVGRGALRVRLLATHDRLAQAARAAGRHPVVDDQWTAREEILHLVVVESEVWQRRLHQLAEPGSPRWTFTEPGLGVAPDERSLDELLAAFETARRATVAQIDSLDDAGWFRSGTHATYGVLDIAGLMRVALDHDEEHHRALAR